MVASKPPQILRLNPSNEILFKGPFDRVVTSFLELTNPSDKRVCFKVKTTAPRRYCVRPNSGFLEPDAHVKIAMMLQPMDSNNQSERTKHKFMVQSTIVQEDDDKPVDDVWKRTNAEDISDSKLSCVFVWDEQGDEATSSDPREPAPLQPETRKMEPIVTQSETRKTDPLVMEHQATPARQRQSSQSDILPMEQKSTIVMTDDYKFVLIGLALLIVGVILGKYVI